ncbi:MAG TPA: FtsW/RodA/SpoVE family cell cycle protein [Propionibacteriaceae bacterium]|nr:FtsW/RodA/SpoVE family cell cycle protein [Propionibacteriaceae bacterium]
MVYRKRRNVELIMDLIAVSIGLGAWALTGLDQTGRLPTDWGWVVGVWTAMALAVHLVIRIRLPYADPLLLPLVLTLNGLGLAMIHRIDLIPSPPRHDATTQMIWTGLGMALFVVTVLWLGDHRDLRRYPYLLFLLGLGLLMMPLVPVLGTTRGGSTIWIHVGSYSFQPAEAAKVVLTIAFSAYLVDHRELLLQVGRHVLGLQLPRVRDLGPIVIMWLASLAVLVFENDLGTSMLFFGLFVMMLYVATERAVWPVLGAVLMAVGGWASYTFTYHVKVRVDAWLHPFNNVDQNYQIIQAEYGMAWGGLTGRGWGLGRPGLTPLAKSDFIAAAIGEELGIIGLMAVIMLYALIVSRGLRMALASEDEFGKLLASGLSFVFALQVFAIIGGVTRLLPLTGLTTPFMSQGGSSMVANWVIIAILLVVSHQARRPNRTPALVPQRTFVADLGSDETAVIQ